MKQKLYIAGIIDLIVVLTGTIFKINHYPGAGILLTLGIAAFAVIICPLALVSSYRRNREEQSKSLYIITAITIFLVFTAMLFKIQHWPFAGLLLTIAMPFPYVVFLPVFIAVASRKRNFNIYNTVFVLFLLVLSSLLNGLLSLNVARVTIEDSYNLSRAMNKVNAHLAGKPVKNESVLELKIDELLGVIDEYQDIILKREGISEKIWDNNPEYLGNPDSRNVVRTALGVNNDMAGGSRLEKAMKAVIAEADSNPVYGELARALPGILELEGNRLQTYFTEDYTSWSLTYLDALETNLRLLKATII